MKKHLAAIALALAMILAGFVGLRKRSADEIYQVQQWTLVIAGAIALLMGVLVARRPRNAGFTFILTSMAVVMSAAMALPFQDGIGGIPSIVLGLAGMGVGIYCMSGTRAGDR